MDKKTALKLGGLLLVVIVGLLAFVLPKVSAFDASVAKVYDLPAPDITARLEPDTLRRGKHLAESLGGCAECHGKDMGGKAGTDIGENSRVFAANLTPGKGGVGAKYTDGELARAIRDGIKADGTTVLVMPSHDFRWWPRDDLEAVVSYVRARPPVDNEVPPPEIGVLGKVLDRMDKTILDVARRIDHDSAPLKESLEPTATAMYGANIALLCKGCHGERLSGGKIPTTDAKTPVASNLTPHATGLRGWTYDQFLALLNDGTKPDGSKLDPFMPIGTLKTMSEIEKKALWAYLQSLDPVEFGHR